VAVVTPAPRVVVVAQASPAQGGIASFAETIVADADLGRSFHMELLNTTRKAVRVGGAPTFANARNALVDTVRAYRAGRRADIVHVQTALVPALPLLRAVAVCGAARLGGARVLCHVHSGKVNSGRPEAFEPGRAMRVALRSLRVAHGILTCADPGTSTMHRLVPGMDVETVDNAVDLQSFCPAEGSPDLVRILFVGTICHRKGVLDLLRAAQLLRERGVSNWGLELVGGAAEVGEGEAGDLRRAFTEAGFGETLVGPLHGDTLRKRLSEADVYVLPSHWEGQPIAILEAMASSLPIVATRVGAVPDVVRDGVEGLVLEPHDPAALAAALERLILSPELRAQLGAAARDRVADRYDTIHLSRRLQDVYRRALSA
jgi:glycosyltransferase involved in cell wall biosynthesis